MVLWIWSFNLKQIDQIEPASQTWTTNPLRLPHPMFQEKLNIAANCTTNPLRLPTFNLQLFGLICNFYGPAESKHKGPAPYLGYILALSYWIIHTYGGPIAHVFRIFGEFQRHPWGFF